VNGIEQLCPNCGLCCDGTLFADVELRKGDDVKRLEKLGLPLKKKGRGKLAFAQPCACFDGRLCTIYEDRPKHCRLFECGLLKRLNSCEMSADTALGKISEAKILAKKVRKLLRSLGQNDEHLALTQRYKIVMSAPTQLSNERDTKRRGELMLTINDLMQMLQRDFLQ
jgi:uncharacterized protein